MTVKSYEVDKFVNNFNDHSAIFITIFLSEYIHSNDATQVKI